jgi:hypothetical protein
MACKEFHLHMRLNYVQKTIVDDIVYKKIKNPTKPFHIFLTRGFSTWKTFILKCIVQNMLWYYINQIINANPLKSKVMKLTYI